MVAHVFAAQHDDAAMNDIVTALACQEPVDRVSWCKSH
jgi:hypothetical protein